jgi:uncharacterized protein YhfF
MPKPAPHKVTVPSLIAILPAYWSPTHQVDWDNPSNWNYLQGISSANKLVMSVAEGTKKIKASFNPECTESNQGKIFGPCIGTNETALALRNGVRCTYDANQENAECSSVVCSI